MAPQNPDESPAEQLYRCTVTFLHEAPRTLHRARRQVFQYSAHLLHPERGAAMVFDIYGMAICPSCGAL